MKRIIMAIIACVLCTTLCGCASLERGCKSCQSELAGGLDRVVVVYDLMGNEMARYEGKLDLATADGCVQFEYNGKRIIWYNAIVSVLEK